MEMEHLYRRLATHYRSVIEAGALARGARFPSVRSLMQRHDVSLSTALQVCRWLEQEGWLEARPRSGFFVSQPAQQLPAIAEPSADIQPDPAQYVGIHVKVSEFIARGRQASIKVAFSSARAAPELYPSEALRQAGARVLKRYPDILVTPGAANGQPEFRQALARRAVDSGMRLAPEEIVVTQGCIEALHLALRAVTVPGDVVAVETPTFYGLLQILEGLGLRALEIPTSPQHGLSLPAFELALRTQESLKAVVVVPHLQNPLGAIMPDAHKAQLVAMCEIHGVALIEDDTYTPLVERNPVPRAIKSWDSTGNVIHCASLHKVLAPGMRLGWISAGRWQARVEMLKYAQSRNNEAMAQLVAADFMASPAYERHLNRLRQHLRRQREHMAVSIFRAFPAGTRMNSPQGGLSLWVELPAGMSSRELFEAALGEGILIAPGLIYSNSDRYEGFIRLNCGMPVTAEVEAALQCLGRLCANLPRRSRR